MRIVFLGTPDFAVESLKQLVEHQYNVVAVVTAPDKQAGRGRKVQATAVKKYALEQGLNILQPTNLKDESFLKELKELKADINIVVAFRMLPQQVWDMPPLGTFNLHASLLPQYRGAAPINWAIVNGENKTGVTTFFLKHKIDTGNIILQEEVNITPEMNAGELHDTLMEKGGVLVVKTLQAIENNNYQVKEQDHIPENTLKEAPKIFKSDLKINWQEPIKLVYNKIRGFSPYPGAWSMLNGKVFKIFSSEIEYAEHHLNAGSIVSNGKDEFKVALQGGFLHLKMVQLEGKKRMPIEDFLRGTQGQVFESIDIK